MGRRKKGSSLTPLELEIMSVLWESGAGTVQRVQELLPGDQRLAYTTVQTMLNILCRKEKVKRVLKGRAFEYAPVVTRQKAARQALHDVINRLFGGSAESLVMSLLESRDLKPEKLEQLKRLVERSQREAKEGRHGDT